MRALLWLLFLALAASRSWAAPPKVAVVYSSWSSYAFRDEFDDKLAALGWPFEKFENVRVADLAARLGEFDLVVSTGVGNYENPQNMAAYRDQWLAFLNRGGCLLITDASYGSVLDLWVNTFGDDFRLTAAQCAPMREANPEARAITVADHPLMAVPSDLAPLFRVRMNIWAHLDAWPQGWQSLVTCRDGKSLFLMKSAGNGIVAVTSEYSFKGVPGMDAARGMLENLWLYAEPRRRGLEVTRLAFGRSAPGPGAAEVGLRNLTAGELRLRAGAQVEPADAAPRPGPTVDALLKPGGATTLRLPFEIRERGKLAVRITVATADGQTLLDWARRAEIAPALTVELKRRHLYPRQEELSARVRLLPETGVAAKLRLEGSVDAAPPASLLQKNEAIEEVDEATISLPVAKLPPGEHRLTVRLRAGERVLGEATETFYTHPEPRVGVREDGVTLLDGKPFFPFGFYHVSWPYDAAQRLKMAQDIGAAGFNCVHASLKTLDEWGPFLDECAKQGLYVVTEFGAPPEPVIRRYRDHPAVLAWNPGDEPDGGGVAPEEMYARYDRFKLLDPGHLVYTTLCVPDAYPRYVRGTDVVAPDPYPIPNAPVSMVYDFLTRATAQAGRYDTTVWGVLQCFGGYGGWTRPPTAKELRAMTYLALLTGVKGIIYYTYADGLWQVVDHPEQWEAAKALVPEIKRLAPALLDGKRTLLAEGRDGLYAGGWSYQGRRYVVIVNSGKEERAFELPVPGKRAEPLFASPTTPTLTDGKLNGKVEALGTVAVAVD